MSNKIVIIAAVRTHTDSSNAPHFPSEFMKTLHTSHIKFKVDAGYYITESMAKLITVESGF